MPEVKVKLDLDAISERCNAATPGPWEQETTNVCGEDFVFSVYRPEDTRFIAHARTDIPNLVDALRAERAENARLRAFEADAKEALEEALVYLAIQLPEDKPCKDCEPGNAYEPEYICGPHQLLFKTSECLAKHFSVGDEK